MGQPPTAQLMLAHLNQPAAQQIIFWPPTAEFETYSTQNHYETKPKLCIGFSQTTKARLSHNVEKNKILTDFSRYQFALGSSSNLGA